MSQFHEPSRLSSALTELIALRGYARFEENRQYHTAWKAVAQEEWQAQARVSRVTRGQMIIEVDHAPLLSELSGFHAQHLLRRLQTEFAPLKIRNLKFRLKGFA